MANPEHVEIVKQGAGAIDAWRKKNPNDRLDLREADLVQARLAQADLSHANLSLANLHGAILIQANLEWTDLSGSDLSGTLLFDAKLSGANLNEALIDGATMGLTNLGNVDLSAVEGLESIQHIRSSSIGVDTLYRSQGKIPEEFLRGCGVPEDFITYLPSLIGAMQPIQYQSCFISYSSQDEEFARRLHEKMRGEKLRVWFAPEDMQGGQKLIEQIDRAIQVNDRLLLVLSEQSMNSEWVKTEIRKARQAELREQRQKLFPIRLVSIDRIRAWSCFDADTGKDLAVELREYHIPDFSNWKNHDPFESAFADLLRDLRAQSQ